MAATRAEKSQNSAENSALAAASGPGDHGRRLFRPVQPRPLRDRRLVLPGHARRGRDPEDHGRGAAGARDRPGRRPDRHAARRRHLAMRPDRQPRHRRRLLQTPQPHRLARRREPLLRGRARHRARRPQPAAQKARVVVSGRCLHRLARHHRRHGRQQFLRRPFAALRHHARQHAVDGRGVGRRQPAAFRRGAIPADNGRDLFRDMLASRRARGRRDRRKLPEGAAPGRRLQSRCAGAAQRPQQSGASAGRLRRHAGLHHPGRAEAVAGDPQQGARRLPFRQLLRGDGCRPASGETAPDRGRTGRPHHAGAGARDRDVPAHHRHRRARRSRCGADRRIRRGGPGRKHPSTEAARRADGRPRLRLGSAASANGAAWSRSPSRHCKPASPSSAPPASTS